MLQNECWMLMMMVLLGGPLECGMQHQQRMMMRHLDLDDADVVPPMMVGHRSDAGDGGCPLSRRCHRRKWHRHLKNGKWAAAQRWGILLKLKEEEVEQTPKSHQRWRPQLRKRMS